MKATRTCSIDGCERPVSARGWCTSHYRRWWETGNPGSAEIRERRPRRDDVCHVEDCDRGHYAKGYCNLHWQRWHKHGDPELVEKPRWSGEDATYNAVHIRMRLQKGKAQSLPCARCGEQAKDWAYDHGDIDERIDAETGYPYSVDLDHYFPLCRPCHTTFDKQGAEWSRSLRSAPA